MVNNIRNVLVGDSLLSQKERVIKPLHLAAQTIQVSQIPSSQNHIQNDAKKDITTQQL